MLVLDTDVGKAFKFSGGDDESAYVVLRFAAQHYEWVKCDSGAIATLWLDAECPKPQGYRGAAKSSLKMSQDASSHRSSLHLSCFSKSNRNKVGRSTSKKSKSKGGLCLTDFASNPDYTEVGSRFSEPFGFKERSPERAAAADDSVQWVCDHCEIVLRSAQNRLLSAKRAQRIRMRHAEIDKQKFHHIQPRLSIVDVSENIDLCSGGCLDPLARHLHQLFVTDDDLFFDVYPDVRLVPSQTSSFAAWTKTSFSPSSPPEMY